MCPENGYYTTFENAGSVRTSSPGSGPSSAADSPRSSYKSTQHLLRPSKPVSRKDYVSLQFCTYSTMQT